ncbi:MAG: hypothetical protein HFJ45_09750 [Clostridia bacterium]|nr:hypothetical protein [Clostridia bacterium]
MYGYYNFFNIGATGNTGNSSAVIQNGLAYAAAQGWSSKTASIVDGTRIIAQNYIAREQDTLYYQKFNVVGTNRYNHQYQQNVLAAQNGGSYLLKLYKKMDSSLSGNYTFLIPLYKNMPTNACSRPSTTIQREDNSSIKMGDLNGDGMVNVIDVVAMINYLNGQNNLSGNNLLAAKLTGGANVTVLDVVLLINYLNGTAVLPSSGVQTGTLISSSNLRLSPNGTVFTTLNSGISIKILSLGTQEINGYYWDLIVTSKGLYGYIARTNYK